MDLVLCMRVKPQNSIPRLNGAITLHTRRASATMLTNVHFEGKVKIQVKR